MYCKDCRYYYEGDCINRKLCEAGERLDEEDDHLTYSYNEGGWFSPDKYFGCIHFKTEEAFLAEAEQEAEKRVKFFGQFKDTDK